jgi:integrase
MVQALQRAEEVTTVTRHGREHNALKYNNNNIRFVLSDMIVRLPENAYAADGVNDASRKATSIAGIGQVSTHTMRHTYRSWLDAVGTSIAVQQKLMRHADIRTTMNVYGDVVTDEME